MTKTATLAEIRAMRDAGDIKKPEPQFSDENLPDSVWKKARLVMPRKEQGND